MQGLEEEEPFDGPLPIEEYGYVIKKRQLHQCFNYPTDPKTDPVKRVPASGNQ